MQEIQLIIALVTGFAIIYGLRLHYQLYRLVREAGYSVSLYLIRQDIWPRIDSMIQQETSVEKKAQMIMVKRRTEICLVITMLGFVGLIATSWSRSGWQ